VRGIAIGTPASPANGQVWFVRETPIYTGSSYTNTSENHFLLQNNFGSVALFHPYGFETNRFHAGTDAAQYNPGVPVLYDGIPSPDGSGITMTAFGLNAGSAILIGLLGSNSRATTTQREAGRVTIMGVCGCRMTAPVPAQAWPEFLWVTNGAGVAWNASSHSALDGLYGLRLTTRNDNHIAPSYLFGAHIWHT
jgi:hypothetical protein